MNKAKPKLELIQGGVALSVTNANRALLYALSPPRPIAAQQLALPGIGPAKRAIVSFGFNGQALGRLSQLLREHDIRYVADLRISPSFRGPDYGPEDVMRLFSRSNIRYRRFPKLGNGFIGESLNHRIVLDMYDQYLTTQTDGLHELHRATDEGPLLLLGWEEQHLPSERSVVIDALSRIGANFELIIATAH
jgi:hypothetical protein